MPRTPILDVGGLTVEYYDEGTGSYTRAVDDVSLSLYEEELVGIVGEASSGKTTLIESLVGALPRNGVVRNGVVSVLGRDWGTLSEAARREMRGADIGYIPSGGHAHLSPVQRVGKQIEAVLRSHQRIGKRDARAKVESLLGQVGLDSPGARAKAYAHELSGGMAQRVVIAMGIACDPRIVLADEPTGGLDVTVQATILDLLSDLLKRHGRAGLLVSRDLGVIANYCSRIVVMHEGKIVESAPVREFLASPQTEYSKNLIVSATAADQLTHA